MLIVDNRWRGNHGISRYSREVIDRFQMPWRPTSLQGNPVSIRSLLGLGLRNSTMSSGDLLYSPGYNAYPRQGRQVVTIHDLIHLHASNPKRRIYDAYYASVLKPIIRRNRIVLTVSETSRSAISNWLGDDKVEIVNAGNGCSDVFVPGGVKSVRPKPYFLYVGNTKPHKNLGTLLRAMHFVPEAELVVVGPTAEDLTALVRSGEPIPFVDLRNNVSDEGLAELYRGAVATVVPSVIEGFGLPALESLRCGTPVVYWRGCDSLREICGDRGIHVEDPLSATEFALALRTALESSEDTTPIDVISGYSWEGVSTKVSQVLRRHMS